jgi:hypothetical protein
VLPEHERGFDVVHAKADEKLAIGSDEPPRAVGFAQGYGRGRMG